MAKKTQPVTDDRKFILGVIRTSIVLLVLAAAAAAVLYFMQDSGPGRHWIWMRFALALCTRGP